MGIDAVLSELADWVRHLDWGNVPSWASAGSLIVAAAVYARDRRRHQRRQVDEVAVWGSVTLKDLDAGPNDPYVPYLQIDLKVKNASKLPIHNIDVQYWLSPSYERNTYSGDDAKLVSDVLLMIDVSHKRMWSVAIVEPDSTSIPRDSRIRLEEFSGKLFSVRLFIERVYVHDSTGKQWILRPESGRGAKPVGSCRYLWYMATSIGRARHI